MKRAATALLSFLALSGCARSPLGYLEGAGPAARSTASLGWGLLAISIAVCLITGALLAFSIFRRRLRIGRVGGRRRRPVVAALDRRRAIDHHRAAAGVGGLDALDGARSVRHLARRSGDDRRHRAAMVVGGSLSFRHAFARVLNGQRSCDSSRRSGSTEPQIARCRSFLLGARSSPARWT